MKFWVKRTPAHRELRILPSLTDEGYLLAIRRLSDTLVRGAASSLFLDRGENFVQSRAYQLGDATTTIDWKASARSRDLIVKEHESLRQTRVSLVLDRSGSMTAGSADTSKYAAACILGGGLAFAALKAANPVAILATDAATHPPATLSSAAISAALLALRTYQPGGRVPLSHTLEEGFRHAGHRQLIFILSDFHDACAVPELAVLAHRHEVILIRLCDPLEFRTPAGATLRVRPAEGGPARFVRHQKSPASASEAAIASLGLPTVHIDPTAPVSRQLAPFLHLRKPLA